MTESHAAWLVLEQYECSPAGGTGQVGQLCFSTVPSNWAKCECIQRICSCATKRSRAASLQVI